MSSKSTCFWAILAAALLAAILLHERFGRRSVPTGPAKVLPHMKAASVSSIKVQRKGQLELRAVRTNDTWVLVEPLAYPAQVTRIANLLAALERLTPAVYISARERQHRPNADDEDGFNPPQAAIMLSQGNYSTRLWVGAKTPPGDQLYLQVIGSDGVDGVYVVDADLLKAIPGTPNDWRDTALMSLKTLAFDHLRVTNGSQVVELQRNAASRLWRIMPIQWRADSAKVNDLLAKLQDLRISRFVSDDPRSDLELYGLQSPGLEVAFGQGTNTVALLQFGKSPTNDASLVYARRAGLASIVTVPKEMLASWYASSANEFRDPHLFTLTSPVQAIEVRGQEQFSLMREGTNNSWRVMPRNFPADAGRVGELVSALSNLSIVEIAKDVVPEPALPGYGLASPSRTYVLTNASGLQAAVVQLDFGTNLEDRVYVRRPDESSVYAIRLADYQRLPASSAQFRDRQLWDVSADDLAGVTIRQQGKVRRIIRKAAHEWSLGPGSTGEVNPLAVEESARMLGRLAVSAWVGRGQQTRAEHGIRDGGYSVSLELKSGGTLSLEFGPESSAGTHYAAVTLEGEPWVFEFPASLYPYIATYLSIPADPR